MPVNAGSQIMSVSHSPRALSVWQGLGVFLCYAAAALIAAAVVVDHRDT